MPGGNHRGVRIRPAAVDDREDPAKRIGADLVIVLVHKGLLPEAQGGQIVRGLGPPGLAGFRRVDEHETDSEAALDLEGVPVNHSGNIALDAETD